MPSRSRTKLTSRSLVDLLMVQLSNLSPLEEVEIVRGPTAMAWSSACAIADVVKNSAKEIATDVLVAGLIRQLQGGWGEIRSKHAGLLGDKTDLGDQTDDRVPNRIELRANKSLRSRKIAELVDRSLAELR
jgi:hypothetical protein